MNLINDICIITNKYPNSIQPNVLVFVQQLVWEFANLGLNCTVISPVPVNINPQYGKLPYIENETNDNGKQITVIRPKYFSLGQTKICGINPAHFSTWAFERTVLKTIKNNHIKPDVLYAHFITPAGIATSRIGRKFGIPVFLAHGEATMMTIEDFGGAKAVQKELKNLTGVIAVSAHNKQMLIDNCIMASDKIKIFPNGFNPNRFKKIDSRIARRKFGWNDSDFIVGFVGSFDERKGIRRLEEAVDKLDNVKFACAGRGKVIPTSDKCIYANSVNHSDLVYFYNACDIFVLPTQMEGCCNAIVEAVACGLPIVSSDRLFNKDILSKKNAILIDPDNVVEIRNAIQSLYKDSNLRKKLTEGSIEKAKELTIRKRAENILEFMKKE